MRISPACTTPVILIVAIALSGVVAFGVVDDMVVYYPFDGDADDAGGSGYDGIVYGATLTSDRDGNADSAYDFDGQNDYIRLPDTTASAISHSTGWTVCLWFYPRDVTSEQTLVGFNVNSGDAPKFRIALGETSGVLEARWKLRGVGWYALHADIDADVYHHVAYVYDPEAGTALFLDGKLEDTDSTTGSSSFDSDYVKIGMHSGSTGGSHFDGIIDGVRIYDRPLSESEIWTLIDDTPPDVEMQASQSILWPPNGKMVPVKVTGEATDLGSGVASVKVTVEDEYGEVEPSASAFGETLLLEASRRGDDMDGRTYRITATATDAAGNTASTTGLVVCPHDRR